MSADMCCSGSPKKLAPTELGVNKIGECAKVMPINPDRADALTPNAPHPGVRLFDNKIRIGKQYD
jgi:hypothetical protein